MKNLLVIIFLTIFTNAVQAQIPEHIVCSQARKMCGLIDQKFDLSGNEEYCTEPLYYYFHLSSMAYNALIFQSLGSTGSFSFYRIPSDDFNSGVCGQIELGTAELIALVPFGPLQSYHDVSFNLPGIYVLRIIHDSCYMNPYPLDGPIPALAFNIHLKSMEAISCPNYEEGEPQNPDELDCTDCISSFSPASGKYMVSAWVSEEGASIHTVTYANASIGVSFTGNVATYQLTPTGRIIDGWQQIQGVVEIPDDATDLHLALKSGTVNAYFDDIRFYPLDGSMVSYVYDPVNLRLMAQLDERNYATFYEYDEEGKLIRVKKETERGVMTIQENRDNIIKKQ